jgi:3-(3-hydroxy-phenyl)propionate hydroxylase
MAASREKRPVIIAGAGPVGLICALGLAQRGVPVIVLEAEARLYEDPRAATTHPATLEMLDDLGLLGEVARQGLHCRHFRFWDRVTGEMVANFDHDLLKGDCRFPYVIQCEQYKTAAIAFDALAALPGTEVRFSHRVTGVRQTADGVTVVIETPNGPAVRRLPDRRRWRAQRGAQGAGYRIRGLHLSRALPGTDLAVRFRRPPGPGLPQLFLRSR